SGRLSVIDRSVDSQTGTIRIRVTFPNPQNVLRAGMTCDLRVQNNTPGGSLLVPYKAVVEQMGEYFAFVVRGTNVSQQRIVLGMSINDKVVVLSGLKEGDQIVTEGVQKLRDNSPVTVQDPANSSVASSPKQH
ncbi:MAG TPA: efflux RND transporter periplasmic adaptor subunit, partial [Bacteroidota bacterium]